MEMYSELSSRESEKSPNVSVPEKTTDDRDEREYSESEQSFHLEIPEEAPSSNKNTDQEEEDHTKELEGDLGTLLASLGSTARAKIARLSLLSLANSEASEVSIDLGKPLTVELEASIMAMLANVGVDANIRASIGRLSLARRQKEQEQLSVIKENDALKDEKSNESRSDQSELRCRLSSLGRRISNGSIKRDGSSLSDSSILSALEIFKNTELTISTEDLFNFAGIGSEQMKQISFSIRSLLLELFDSDSTSIGSKIESEVMRNLTERLEGRFEEGSIEKMISVLRGNASNVSTLMKMQEIIYGISNDEENLKQKMKDLVERIRSSVFGYLTKHEIAVVRMVISALEAVDEQFRVDIEKAKSSRERFKNIKTLCKTAEDVIELEARNQENVLKKEEILKTVSNIREEVRHFQEGLKMASERRKDLEGRIEEQKRAKEERKKRRKLIKTFKATKIELENAEKEAESDLQLFRLQMNIGQWSKSRPMKITKTHISVPFSLPHTPHTLLEVSFFIDPSNNQVVRKGIASVHAEFDKTKRSITRRLEPNSKELSRALFSMDEGIFRDGTGIVYRGMEKVQRVDQISGAIQLVSWAVARTKALVNEVSEIEANKIVWIDPSVDQKTLTFGVEVATDWTKSRKVELNFLASLSDGCVLSVSKVGGNLSPETLEGLYDVLDRCGFKRMAGMVALDGSFASIGRCVKAVEVFINS
uniref:Uncharacterized protein n=1 Tax=Vaucheria litorea TaxID=109269 RepID=H6WBB9_VAULI|nr:hypothetical protein [Vaucheria litorea]